MTGVDQPCRAVDLPARPGLVERLVEQRRPARSPGQPGDEQGEQHEEGEHGPRRPQEAEIDLRTRLDGAAEEVGRARAERALERHGGAARSPRVVRPAHRLRPLRLDVRPVRARIGAALLLSPVAVVRQPGERRRGRGGPVGEEDGVRLHACARGRACRRSRSPPARCGRARLSTRSSSRASRGPGRRSGACRASGELGVVPLRPLRAVVLGEPDLGRPPLERLRRRGGVEHQLDHLPVRLVLVVPVVERVVEPVLECELPGLAPLGDDVRIGRRLLTGADLSRPLLVAAARIQGRAGEIEIHVEVTAPEQVSRRRRRFQKLAVTVHELDVGAAEHDVRRYGTVGLPVRVAGLVLLLESDDRRVPVRELLLRRRRVRRYGEAGRNPDRERAGDEQESE